MALLALGLSGVYLCAVSLHVPLFADDLCRAHHDFSLGRAFDAAADDYMHWSGRFPVMLLSNLWFSGNGLGIVILAGLNGLIFALVPLVLVRWLGSGRRAGDLCWLVWYFGLFWFSTRSFGEAVFWKTGSVQYFWGVVLAALLLVPMTRTSIEGTGATSRPLALPLYVVLCFFGGMWLEHVSVALAATGACLYAYHRAVHGSGWPRWLTASFCAWLAGAAVLIAAPGNYERMDAFGHSDPLTSRIVGVTSYLLPQMDPLVLLSIIAFLVIALIRRPRGYHRKLLESLAFFATGVVAAYATVGAPVTVLAGRVAFPSQYFFVLAAMALFPVQLFADPLDRHQQRARRGLLVATAIIAGVLLFDMVNIYEVYRKIGRQDLARREMIAAALARGEDRIKLPALYFSRRLNTYGREVNIGRRFARDITIDPSNPTNACFARFYGLRRVAL
jgi:hypothetical protein